MHEIKKGLQNIKFSGVGAHHQNSIAEQGIQTILMKAQPLLIHAAIHWPTQADSDLLPMTFDYALHHLNHMQQKLGFCKVSHPLKDEWVFGCSLTTRLADQTTTQQLK